jgi:hypothetical protein
MASERYHNSGNEGLHQSVEQTQSLDEENTNVEVEHVEPIHFYFESLQPVHPSTAPRHINRYRKLSLFFCFDLKFSNEN